jgi:hypothetical protein
MKRERVWWLSQANRSVFDQVMAIARKIEPRSADAWAARVLAVLRQRGSDDGPSVLRTAQMLELAHELQTPSPNISEVRRLVDAINGPRPADAPIRQLRSEEAARKAYNYPHWITTASGLIAPDETRIRGGVAREWALIKIKFSNDLAQAMFDANVRGGIMAVIDVMNAAGSNRILTLRDVARLHFTATSDGVETSPNTMRTHDALHTYGVSVLEELHGDAFSEELLKRLFATTPPEIAIDVGTPLGRQPATVRQLAQLIDRQFDSLSTFSLAGAAFTFFLNDLMDTHNDELVLKEAIANGPALNAQRAEQILDRHGLLAHLSPANRQQVLSLVYGADQPQTFEAIAKRWARSGDQPEFEVDLIDWAVLLGERLAETSQDSLMSRGEFTQFAMKAIAFGLLLERTQPGALTRQPLDTTLDDLPGLERLDLRVAFPPALREVEDAFAALP